MQGKTKKAPTNSTKPEVAEKKAKKKVSPDEDLLTVARERFKLAEQAWSEPRVQALEDLRFRAGEQWREEERQRRELDGRPCMVVNRMPQFIRQITNDQRQNRPDTKVHPFDDKADVETARVFNGLIRSIKNNSGADVAYDTATEGAATGGFGFFRIYTEYESPLSFNQVAKFGAIDNPNMVSLDPHSVEPDGSDAKWGFFFQDYSKEDFCAEHAESELASMADWESLGATMPGWMDSKSCRVAEYMYIENREAKIYLLSDESVVEEKDLKSVLELNPKLTIEDERTTQVPTVKWVKMTGNEILDRRDLPGRHIPIFPVYGDRLNVDGERIYEGVIRHAKDPQRMYNYMKSMIAETIALAPRAPWVGAEGQFEGYEHKWASANRENHAFLEYKPTVLDNGQIAPPPQRSVAEPPIMAMTQAAMGEAEDMKATTGIYDAGLGARSNETSGIAIQQRATQSQTSNFHIVDNLNRTIRHADRVLVDWIPVIYDTARAVRILGEDGVEEIVRINEVFAQDGAEKEINFSVGKYDVVVESGPSYATKRQEAASSMLEFMRYYPNAAPIIGDLFAASMDWPKSQEVAARLKAMLPPEVKALEGSFDPAAMQAQLAQSQQIIQLLSAQLQAANDKANQKAQEIASRERVEFAKIDKDIAIAAAKMDQADSRAIFEAQMAEVQSYQNQIQNGAGQEMALPVNQQQPPGGFSPAYTNGAIP